MKGIGIILALTMAMLSVSIAAGSEDSVTGNDCVDVFGDGIFETKGSLFKYQSDQDTNIDTLEVGNDKALALGNIWLNVPQGTAANDLEIKKNQNSGDCICCSYLPDVSVSNYVNAKSSLEQNVKDNHLEQNICQDCCIKVNIDDIKTGNRNAMALGFATATNKIKIVADQE